MKEGRVSSGFGGVLQVIRQDPGSVLGVYEVWALCLSVFRGLRASLAWSWYWGGQVCLTLGPSLA